MPRTFAYCRLASEQESAQNQLAQMEAAGFTIEPAYAMVEVISVIAPATAPESARSGFARLVDRLAAGDELVVIGLDGLGRDARDMFATVERLVAAGTRVYCLALGRFDLASPAGRPMIDAIAAMANFELSVVTERVLAGQARAKAAGKRLGRPKTRRGEESPAGRQRRLPPETVARLYEMRLNGASYAQLGAEFGIHKSSVQHYVRRLQEGGLTRPNGRPRRFSPETEARIYQQRMDGASFGDLAREYGMSRTLAQSIVKRLKARR